MSARRDEYLLLYHCAPTLYKKKTASLFSLGGVDKIKLPYIINTYSRLVNSLDLKVTILCGCEKNTLVYVYNEKQLARILNAPETSEFLKKYGYSGCRMVDEYIDVLRKRIASSGVFPHEIGIFLDYPLYDVIGFIANGGKNFIHSGDWKVYHNKSGAVKKFNSYRACRRDVCRKLDSGLSACEILKRVS